MSAPTAFDLGLKVFSMTSHLADITTDFRSGILYILRGDDWWGGLTLTFVIYNMIVCGQFARKLADKAGHKRPWLWLIFFPLAGFGSLVWDFAMAVKEYRIGKHTGASGQSSNSNNDTSNIQMADTSTVALINDTNTSISQDNDNTTDNSNSQDTSTSNIVAQDKGTNTSQDTSNNTTTSSTVTQDNGNGINQNTNSNNSRNSNNNDTSNNTNTSSSTTEANEEDTSSTTSSTTEANVEDTSSTTSSTTEANVEDTSSTTSDDVPPHVGAAMVAKVSEAFTEALPQCCITTHAIFQTAFVPEVGGTVETFQWVSLSISILSLAAGIATNPLWEIESKWKKVLLFLLVLPVIVSRLIVSATFGTLQSWMFIIPMATEVLALIIMRIIKCCCDVKLLKSKTFWVLYSSIPVWFALACIYINAVPQGLTIAALVVAVVAAVVQTWHLWKAQDLI